ncbi:MAG TPA: saccharopine dehydrogenase C-terminal domain-containing protein [bacterium]|jgi:lysine 6-dehydrogenase
MDKPEILIVGAGLMGRAAAYFFRNHPQGPFPVLLADHDEAVLDSAEKILADGNRVHTMRLDATRNDMLLRALSGVRVCLSCVPYFLNPAIARACLSLGVSYVDLGLKADVTDEILKMDEDCRARGVAFIPDTGFSPGLLNIVVWELVHRFKKCDDVRLWAGGLPQVPTGPLNYTAFFSIHGLVNEYFEDAREIRNGKVVTVPSLSDLETIDFPGHGTFEAFVTSGGTSTLPRTLEGKVNRLSYKTMRYPGHMEALEYLRDLGLADLTPYEFKCGQLSPREMLVKVLEAKLPKDVADMVLVRVAATGDGGKQEKIELVVKPDASSGLSAMEQVTGFPAAAVTLAILQGKVAPGSHAQETVIPFGWMKEQLGYYGITL